MHDFLPLCYQLMQRRFFSLDPHMQDRKPFEFNRLCKVKPCRFEAKRLRFRRAIVPNTNGATKALGPNAPNLQCFAQSLRQNQCKAEFNGQIRIDALIAPFSGTTGTSTRQHHRIKPSPRNRKYSL